MPSLAQDLSETISRSQPPKHVLFVDDDQPLRELLIEICKAFDVILSFAGDFVSAVRLLETLEHVDLGVFDIRLPGGGDGLDLYVECHRRWPDTKICLITGHSLDAIVDRVRAIGAARVLRKPIDLINSRFIESIFEENGIRKKT
jgi:DNA-binding NtrC family response regulator